MASLVSFEGLQENGGPQQGKGEGTFKGRASIIV